MIEWSTSTMVGRSMGIDVAWGDTSKFAIVITQYRNNKVEVFYVESFEKPLMNEIIDHIMRLKLRHHCTRVYVDGANPEVIRELKRKIGEFENYHYYTEEQLWLMRSGDMQIIPVNFQKRHREMLQWTYTLMSKRFIKIHPSLQQLIVSLRTAVVIDDWKLDKYHTSHLTHLGLLVLTTRCQKVNGYDRLPLMELFRGSDMRFLKSSSNPLQP